MYWSTHQQISQWTCCFPWTIRFPRSKIHTHQFLFLIKMHFFLLDLDFCSWWIFWTSNFRYFQSKKRIHKRNQYHWRGRRKTDSSGCASSRNDGIFQYNSFTHQRHSKFYHRIFWFSNSRQFAATSHTKRNQRMVVLFSLEEKKNPKRIFVMIIYNVFVFFCFALSH